MLSTTSSSYNRRRKPSTSSKLDDCMTASASGDRPLACHGPSCAKARKMTPRDENIQVDNSTCLAMTDYRVANIHFPKVNDSNDVISNVDTGSNVIEKSASTAGDCCRLSIAVYCNDNAIGDCEEDTIDFLANASLPTGSESEIVSHRYPTAASKELLQQTWTTTSSEIKVADTSHSTTLDEINCESQNVCLIPDFGQDTVNSIEPKYVVQQGDGWAAADAENFRRCPPQSFAVSSNIEGVVDTESYQKYAFSQHSRTAVMEICPIDSAELKANGVSCAVSTSDTWSRDSIASSCDQASFVGQNSSTSSPPWKLNQLDCAFYINNNPLPTACQLLSERDPVTLARQIAELDRLTVTRLRTECRVRQLPVSGRKRNLVRRLLPFADVILATDGSCSSSNAVHAPATFSAIDTLPTDVITNCMSETYGSSTCQTSLTTYSMCSWPPSSEMTASNVMGDQETKPEGESSELDKDPSANERFFSSRSPNINCFQPEIVEYAERETGCSDFGTGCDLNSVAELPYPISHTSDGSLSERWVRQQHVIDNMRQQLKQYRLALDRAKYFRSAIKEAENYVAVADRFTADNNDGYRKISTKFVDCTVVSDDDDTVDDMSSACSEINGNTHPYSLQQQPPQQQHQPPQQPQPVYSADSGASNSQYHTIASKEPPDYYEAVKSLRQIGNDLDCPILTPPEETCTWFITSPYEYETYQFTIDDVMDVLTNSGDRTFQSVVTDSIDEDIPKEL